MASLTGVRPPFGRHLAGRLGVAAVVVTAVFIGTTMVGLPTTASAKTKSKSKATQSKKVSKSASRTSTGSARKSTSPSRHYKSKYRKKDPPPNGGRRPRIKPDRPPTHKIKNPPSGGRVRRPREYPINDGPVHIIEPGPLPPPFVVIDPFPVVYYEEPYVYDKRKSDYSVEYANVLFAAGSLALNYVFIREGQTNEFAAGVGIFFGLTSMAVASRSDAKHPVLGWFMGATAIAFSVWNLTGGMDNAQPYEDVGVYERDPYYSAAPAGQPIGWTVSF